MRGRRRRAREAERRRDAGRRGPGASPADPRDVAASPTQPPQRREPEFTIRQPGGRAARPSSARTAFAGIAPAPGGPGRAGADGNRPRRQPRASRPSDTAEGRHGGRAAAARRQRQGSRGPRPAVTGPAAAAAGPRRRTSPDNAIMTEFTGKHRPDHRRRQQAVDCLGDRAGVGQRAAPGSRSPIQGERLEENVHELAAGARRNPLVLPCDVTSDEQIADVAATIDREFGGLDFVVHGAAFAPREELSPPFSTPRAKASASRSTSAPTR